ncbi:MAG: ABC transporter ATP-binding protein [Pseudoclavibacter sp.]|nr:ABC transporter ATP-binding protein [Pseudoclavibacter sp.]
MSASEAAEGCRLAAESITIGYEGRTVSEELTLHVPDGGLTVIVGPNACGKSTLLKALGRLIPARRGRVLLDGRDIASPPSRELARTLGLLPQSPIAPEGITVAELVARGRHPHQGLLRRWSQEDERAVAEALRACGVAELSGRRLEELSGGQRQRAWIAMALAQQPSVLLLDEPTSFLDMAHQLELMELLTRLRRAGTTLVAVLHDLNQAARYASRLVVMRDGRILAQGPPERILTAQLVEEAFDLRCAVHPDPVFGAPSVTPIARIARD